MCYHILVRRGLVPHISALMGVEVGEYQFVFCKYLLLLWMLLNMALGKFIYPHSVISCLGVIACVLA